MVCGEGQKFPSALIVPSYPFIRDWAKKKGSDYSQLSNEEIAQKEEVVDRIQQEVDKFNELYGSWEKIKKFCLLDHEFSIETGELTPTLKLKRKIILEKYKKEVDCFYSGGDAAHSEG